MYEVSLTEHPVVLPNGMVGRLYDHVLNFKTPPDTVVERCELGGLEKSGLTLDVATFRLAGEPVAAGRYPFSLAIYLRQTNQVRHLTLQGTLLVNPDPRSLWQAHEPPANSPYPKPHVHAMSTFGEDFVCIAASVRGRAKAHAGKFRDDDVQVAHLASGWHLMVVADGAGSSELSREGARVACESVVTALREEALPDVPGGWRSLSVDDERRQAFEERIATRVIAAVRRAYDAIVELSETLGRSSDDFATTLLVTLCRRCDDGWMVVCFGIGDGAVAAMANRGQKSVLLNRPDSGSFAGQTRFLTSYPPSWDEGSLARLRMVLMDELVALIAMTDGVSDAKFDSEQALNEDDSWRRVWRELKDVLDPFADERLSEERLCDWLKFWSQGNHDDRTIAIFCDKNKLQSG